MGHGDPRAPGSPGAGWPNSSVLACCLAAMLLPCCRHLGVAVAMARGSAAG